MPKTILLVDDEEIILDSLCSILKKDGYEVDCARSGNEALNILQTKKYSLVITDIRMPGMNGLEVVERMKTLTPTPKVMVMTGYGSRETAVKAQHHGVYDYLVKPIDIQGLKSSIRRILQSADTAIPAGKNRLDNKLKDWTEYLTLISDFTAALNASLDVREILDTALDRLRKIVETECSSLYLFSNVIGELYYLKKIKHLSALSAGSGISTMLGQGMECIAEALLLSLQEASEDVERDPARSPIYDAMSREGIQHGFFMPLLIKGRMIGVVDVCSSRCEPFTGIDVNLCKTLVSQTSLALAKAFSYLEMEERSKEVGLLYNLSLRLNQSLKITDSIKAICEGAVEITGASGSLLQTSLEPGAIKNFIFNGDLGFHKEMKRRSRDWLIPAGARKQAFFSNDPVMDPRVNSIALYSLGIRSMAYVPLIYEWEDLGGLTVFHKSEGKGFDQRDLHLLHLFARHASEVLLNSQLFESIKKSREKTITEKNKMDIILGNMTDGVVTIGTGGEITYINSAMLGMLDIDEEQALGRTCSDVFKMEHCKSDCPLYSSPADRNTRKFFEDTLTGKGGKSMSIYVSFSPTLDDKGRVSGWVKVVRNIDKIKEVKNLKSSFFHVLAHDLRTPLASLLGFVEILGQLDGVPENQEKYLKVMRDYACEMNAIITYLLGVYGGDNAGLKVNSRDVDMKDLVESALKEMEGMAQLKRVSLSGLESDDVASVRADSDQIKRALKNLLSNAIKCTPGGGSIKVKVKRLSRSDEKASGYEISVEDNGRGMAQDELDMIFDRYYQAENNNDGMKCGTGLGLAISKEIIEAHGGRIWAESAQNGGTKLKFTLPGKAA